MSKKLRRLSKHDTMTGVREARTIFNDGCIHAMVRAGSRRFWSSTEERRNSPDNPYTNNWKNDMVYDK